jgi:dihydropyrimidinase
MQQNSCDILIKNACGVIIPKIGIIQTNILVENGKIKSLRKSIDNVQASRKINANGKYILPGAIDPHVHYGVYTPIDEAAMTESRSAAIGGVTTMIRMLRLKGSYKNIEEQLDASKSKHYIDYSIHASLLQSEQLGDIHYLARKIGVNSFKVYMNLGADLNQIFLDLNPKCKKIIEGEFNVTDELVYSVLTLVSSIDALVLVHAEDPFICSAFTSRARSDRNLKDRSLKTWSDCRPPYSEARCITKISEYARKFRSNLYFVHVGSNTALETILTEREKGNSNLYIETCPHYLTHTTDFGNLVGKVVPPIRSKSDVQSIWSALRNGLIDTIGTDHVANRLSMKIGNKDIWSALAGFPGTATMIPVLLSKGVNEERITLEQVAQVTSYNTARIFGMFPKKGTIREGSDADVMMVDLRLTKRVSPEILKSYSDYTIYDGWKLEGWPVMTMVRGKVIMENGDIDSRAAGHGKFVSRPVIKYK